MRAFHKSERGAGRIALLLTVALGVILAVAGNVEQRTRTAEAAVITVDSAADTAGSCPSSPCTLRGAITYANANPGTDITFNIPGAGPHVIALTGDLPAVTLPTTLDATSQPGYAGTPLIVIDGGSTISETVGLRVAGGSSAILGFNIRNLTGNGIELASAGSNVVESNFVGTDAAGTTPNAITGCGIAVLAVSDNNTIGGNSAGKRNVVGTGYCGIGLQGNSNVVVGNYAGIGADGTTPIGSTYGIGILGGDFNTIGGTQPSERNVVGSNASVGVVMSTGADANEILGNYIGTAADGTTARANPTGVYIESNVNNIVGRVSPGSGNVIANGTTGVGVSACPGAASGHQIRGNSLYANTTTGIGFLCGANGGIAPPTMTAATFPPQGTTCASCDVDVYSDAGSQGATYEGSTKADGAGNWTFYDRVDGPNVTAIATDGAGNSSTFSSALVRPACSSVCTEGLFKFTYAGTATHNCTTWNNQSGASTVWGHASCTDATEFNYTGTLSGGTLTESTATINPPGLASSVTGTYTATTASGTWFCTIGCADSGTWSGTKVADSITIPSGGGTSSFVPGVPAATVDAPPGSPAIAVSAEPLNNVTSTIMRTGYNFLPHGYMPPEETPVQLTVNYVAATDLPPPPATCADLAQYKYDPATGTSSFESRIVCNTAQSKFTTPIRSFSVHRFETGRDTDGDGIDDGADVCPLVVDVAQTHSDAHILDFGILKAYDDVTMPWGDDSGDACDTDGDRDNDGLTDAQEAVGCGFGPTNPAARDTDGDLFLDSAECQLGKNPNLISLKPLFSACGSITDPDNDGIITAREFCYYGTDPNNDNSDAQHDNIAADTCKDGQEVANINGDFLVSAIDLSQMAQTFGTYTLPGDAVHVDFDITKDGNINATDLSQVAQRFSPSCQTFTAP